MAKHWMQKAFSNAHGQLHRDTHTPLDQKIPEKKLQEAAHGYFGKKAKKRAQPVINAEK